MRISAALKLEIEHTFEMAPTRHRGSELYFKCPEPGCNDKSGHRAVNLDNGKTSCFICHKDGDFFRWARRLGYHFSASSEDGPLARELIKVEPIKPKLLLPGIVAVPLPRGFTLLSEEPTSVYTKFITRMAKRKNLTYEDFVEAGVGFTRDDPKWEEYAIFPVVEYGTVVYYQGRLYSKGDPERGTKLFPSRTDIPYGSKYWVYNFDELNETKASTALVVESILNVLSLKWKLRELGRTDVVPVCVFKHSISKEQTVKLSRMRNLKEVCLLWDRDATGRAWDGARFLTSRFNVSVAEMPERPGERTLDANDDVEAAIEAFDNRKTYTPYNAVQHTLSNMRVPDWSARVVDSCS